MFGFLPRRRAGQPISAARENIETDIIEALAGIRAGRGIGLTKGAAGVTLSLLARMGEYLIPARITAVEGADGDAGHDVYYSAVALRSGEAKIERRTPRYGRVLGPDAALWTARVGDLCFIVRVPQDNGEFSDDLCVLTEFPQTATCNATGSTPNPDPRPAPGGGPSPPPPPPPPPPPSPPTESSVPPAGGGAE